jgi:hypothetical protein
VLEFVANDGATYIVERTKTKKLNTIKVNGRQSGQNSIDNIVGADYRLFSSAFCVGDFMKFEPKERREILLELVPAPDNRLGIWTTITGETECPYDLSDIEGSYKQAKTELDEIDSKIATATNIKQFLANEISELRAVANTELPEGSVSIKEFEDAQYAYNSLLKHEPKLENFISGEAAPVGELQDKLSIAKANLDAAIAQQPSKAEVDGLLIKMNTQNELLEKLTNSIACPTCKRPFDDTSKQEEQIKIATTVLNDIKKEGSTKNKEYELAFELWEKKVEELKLTVNKYETEIRTTQENNASSVADGKTKWAAAHSKWEEDKEKAGNLFLQIKSKYETSEGERIKKDNAVSQLEEKESQLAAENTKLKSLDRSKLKNAVDAFGAKGITLKEVEGQLKEIHKFLPADCNLKLVEKNKTNDGVKSIFNLSYDNIPYAWLSTGKKLSIDVHLADVITSKLGLNMMFVDNLETLTAKIAVIDGEKKQIFTARAMDTDFSFESS